MSAFSSMDCTRTSVSMLWVGCSKRMRKGTATLPGPVFEGFNNVPFLFCSFDGDLDEIRLWGAALVGPQIASRRFGTVSASTAGLIAYWPLEGTGQIIFDRTLIGSDGVAGDFSTPDPRDPVAITDGAF